MKIILFSLLLFFNFKTTAQATYQKRYATNYGGISNIVTFNDNTVILGPSPLIKLDYMGNIIWSKNLIADSISDLNSNIIKTSENNILLGYSTGTPTYSGVLIKLDTSGNILWSKKYHSAQGRFGRLTNETIDGGFLFTGFESNGSMFILKIDSSGNSKWCRTYKVDTILYIVPHDIIQTDDGGLLMGADYFNVWNSNFPVNIYFVIKLDPLGNVLHVFTSHFGESYEGNFFKMGLNKYFVPGDGSIMCFDTTGELVWERWVYFDYWLHGVKKVNNHVICPGNITALNSNSTSDTTYIGFIEFDTLGNKVQVMYCEHPDTLSINAIGMFNDGTFITNGVIAPYNDAYLIKSDTNTLSGCYEYPVSVWDSLIPDVSSPLTITTGTDSVIVTNYFPTVIPIHLTDSVFCYHAVGISEPKVENLQLNISPNHISSEELTLTYNALKEPATVSIYHTDGKEVAHYAFPQWSRTQQLKLPKLASGMYFVVLQSGARRMTGRFVKE